MAQALVQLFVVILVLSAGGMVFGFDFNDIISMISNFFN